MTKEKKSSTRRASKFPATLQEHPSAAILKNTYNVPMLANTHCSILRDIPNQQLQLLIQLPRSPNQLLTRPIIPRHQPTRQHIHNPTPLPLLILHQQHLNRHKQPRINIPLQHRNRNQRIPQDEALNLQRRPIDLRFRRLRPVDRQPGAVVDGVEFHEVVWAEEL